MRKRGRGRPRDTNLENIKKFLSLTRNEKMKRLVQKKRRIVAATKSLNKKKKKIVQ